MSEFVRTALSSFPVGFGAGSIGDPSLSDGDAERLLLGVVDLGIRLIDTARSYGLSEERIGRALSPRRNEVLLSTKVGYGIEGIPDWTAPCITAGVERALRVLRTDVVDIVHLHSCPVEVLERGDVVEALTRARDEGKIRAAAYSGDNEALRFAIAGGRFDSIQTSVSVADQHELPAVADAASRGLGVIAKRPLANAVWRFEHRPDAPDLATYFDRWQRLALYDLGLDPAELAIRFTLSVAGVSSAIVGSRSLEHVRALTTLANKGPLPDEVFAAVRERFARHGGWEGVI